MLQPLSGVTVLTDQVGKRPEWERGRWRGRYQAGDVRGHADVTLGEGKTVRQTHGDRTASRAARPTSPESAASYPATVSPSTRAARSTSANPTYNGVKPKRRTSGCRKSPTTPRS